MEPDVDVFVAGQQYKVYITFESDDGYIFYRDKPRFINSEYADGGGLIGPGYSTGTVMQIWYTFPALSSVLRGDVNGDGNVNSNDAIHLLRHTMDATRFPINQSGDMNGDGAVNSNDAIRLLRHTMDPARYPLS